MKIISWNINGYRAISGQNPKTKYGKKFYKNYLFKYIEEQNPDIICLQETKSDIDEINEDLRFPNGYVGYYNSSRSKKGYSGTVTFSKKKPQSVNLEIGIDKFDQEGRIVEADFGDFIHYNIYFPKGYADSERLDFKLEFYDSLFEHINKKMDEGREIIVSGDYNTAHKEIDLARPKENVGTSGFMPEERKKLDEIIAMGYIDAFRQIISEGNHFTWWSQRGKARENNVGWRIDYHFITNNLSKKLINAYHHPDQKGSDHCPVVIELDL